MRRAHPSYQLESLVLRAFCHQFWPLCKKAKPNAEVMKLDMKLRKLKKSSPQMINGKSILVRHSIQRSLLRATPYTRDSVRHESLAQASRPWKALPLRQKASFRMTAMAEATHRRADLHASLRRLREERSRHLQAAESKRLARGCLASVDDMRFTEEDLLVLQGMYAGAASSGSGFSAPNMEALHVPPLPDEDGRWAIMGQDFFRRPCHQ